MELSEPTYITDRVLEKCPLLEKEFRNKGSLHHFGKGHTFIRQGYHSRWLFLVMSGTVYCSYTSLEGKRKILYLFRDGAFFGISSLDGTVATYDFIALTEVSVYVLPASDMKLLSNSALLSIALLQKQKERMITRQLHARITMNAENRLRLLFRELSAGSSMTDAEGMVPLPKIPQHILGEIIGVSRIHINLAINRLLKEGYLYIDEQKQLFLTALEKNEEQESES